MVVVAVAEAVVVAVAVTVVLVVAVAGRWLERRTRRLLLRLRLRLRRLRLHPRDRPRRRAPAMPASPIHPQSPSACMVIVGASQGLGAALAECAARRTGWGVVLTSRNAARLALVAGEINARYGAGTALAAPGDAALESDMVRVVDEAADRFGSVACVVFCTGVNHDAALAEWPDCAAFREVVSTNLVGAGHVAFAALPHLSRSGGALVAITSMAGVLGCVPGGSSYAASKAGMDAFFGSIAPELKRVGVRTLIVEPGSFHADDGAPRQVVGASAGRYAGARAARRGVPASAVAERVLDAVLAGRDGRVWPRTRLVPWLGLSLKMLVPSLFERLAMRARPGALPTVARPRGARRPSDA